MRIVLYHWSKEPNLKVIDPKYHGMGLKGAEQKRREQWPQYYVNRSYYGTKEYEKEEGLGLYRYSVKVDNNQLYNLTSDKHNFREKAIDKNGFFNPTKMEKLIKKAGYLGLYNPDYAVVAIFKPLIPFEKIED